MAHSFGKFPENPGIYLFRNKEGEIIYVGKAKNLRRRISSYFQKFENLGEKTQSLIEKTERIETVNTRGEIESLLLEAEYIKKNRPYYNVRLADDKYYPYIRITRDKYPKVLFTRSRKFEDSDYFGPYPSASDLKLVLRTIRRIFPFQSVLNHPKKPCLYNHLGLCPCPYVYDSKTMEKDYKKNIRRIKSFLAGQIKKIEKELTVEREKSIKNEEFEKASQVQKKISAIEYITSPSYKPFEYEVNPNLEEDIRKKEMDELVRILHAHGVDVKNVERIECYDISNISGKLATGSMVVFENGGKNTSEYRRFKIRKDIVGPNDFAMMQEVLKRRFKRQGWPMPGLIVIDGGKGQISAAQKALKEEGIYIPTIGLAKRLETIITSDFKEISLPRGSDPLKLVMRIRDEAHRFALSYHRKLRKNYLLSKL